MMSADTPHNSTSRRDFLKTAGAIAGTAALLGTFPGGVHAGGNDTLRVGLIGCGSPRGGRGRGAAMQCVNAGPNVKLVAMADLFQDHLDYTRNYLKEKVGDKLAVKDDNCFIGFDAYKKVCELKDVDLVILTAPPGFRPMHLECAVANGKHIFAEKPVAVDVPGALRVQKACEVAKQKGLAVVSGLCWRYDAEKRATLQQVLDGAIGDIVTMQCSYNTGYLWNIPREKNWTDMEWQIRNWLYFTWLSGDHNVEQHIHSLDKMAWAMKDEYPVKAVGLGGRQTRTDDLFGNIFDHHAVVYEYKNGVKLFAYCRQIAGCANDVSDHIWGTKGVCDVFKHSIKGEKPWKYAKTDNKVDMYQQEHNELIASIRDGRPINNGEYMVNSTLMAIMGRLATYTGQEITWDKLLKSKEDLSPPQYEMGSLPMPPVAKPGITKFI
jgi:predicted dehydrogenase